MVVNIFVAGDFHIPSRATMLHPKFQRILESKQWDYVVLTGDYTIPAVLKRFEPHLINKKNLIACRGNMDKFSLPNKPTFEVQGIRFGVYHGTDIHPRADIRQLKTIADDLQVKVLFNGHSHKTLVYNDDTHILLNPGTSTGASGGSSWTVDTGIITVALTQDELMIDLFVITEKRKMRKESIKVLL